VEIRLVEPKSNLIDFAQQNNKVVKC